MKKMQIVKPKRQLTDTQIQYIARYMTASNLGTIPPKCSADDLVVVKEYVDLYYTVARRNHDDAGVDITPELKSWIRDVKKDPNYWAGAFEKEFGPGSVDSLV